MEAASVPWRPLGRLLVEKGLLSGEQLERALDEQAVTGRRLGEILVELGFVTRAHLSLALAEQYGFELTADTGFGTGLRAQLERRQEAGRRTEAGPALTLVPDPEPDEEPPADEDPLHFAQLEEQWAKLAAAEASLAEAERELARWRRLGERKRAQAERLLRRLRARELPAQTADPGLGHLVLVRIADGYELVERDGDVPPPGAPLELPGIGAEAFVVERIGRSPLPGDPRRCAVAAPA